MKTFKEVALENAVSDLIMDLIDEAELDGICQSDLQGMAGAKAIRIIELVRKSIGGIK